jgi:AcrR family transcriptional regulator
MAAQPTAPILCSKMDLGIQLWQLFCLGMAPYTSVMNELVHSSLPAKPAPKALASSRTNDPARTMAGILSVATDEFANKGLSGARIDEIAAATKTSKRMIYYYFGSKEGLYLAVLEESYRRMRSIEAQLHLEDLGPEAALRRLVEFTFDHHMGNPNYIRLVMTENMERGAYLAQSKSIQQLNVPAIRSIQLLYERGVEQGVFRPGLDPVDIHASISALTFFNVSNQHTFGLIFKTGAATSEKLVQRRTSIVDMVLRFVKI